MEEIKIKMKMIGNERVYIISINKSDTVLKLKEKCEKETNIPALQQNLFYKGRMLSNEKLINYYNLDNDQTIILEKKQISSDLSSTFLNNNSSNIGFNQNLVDITQETKILSDLGFNKCNPNEINQIFNNPSIIQKMNNIIKEPSLFQMFAKNPINDILSRNIPFLQTVYDNPQLFQMMISPENFQMISNIISGMNINNINDTELERASEIEENPIDSVDILQIFSMLLDLGKFEIKPNNSENNKICEVLEDKEKNINYKEKYKEQLNILNDMGFIEEEINIQVLIQCKGNIEYAIEMLCNIFK